MKEGVIFLVQNKNSCWLLSPSTLALKKIKDKKIPLKHSESPSSEVVMSFNAKKTTHFDKLDIFGFLMI